MKHKIVCAWCEETIQDGEELDIGFGPMPSHGICNSCKFKQDCIMEFRRCYNVSCFADEQIEKIYGDSLAMAKIRFRVAVRNFRKITANEFIKGFKKIKELFNAKNS